MDLHWTSLPVTTKRVAPYLSILLGLLASGCPDYEGQINDGYDAQRLEWSETCLSG
jgi:hypothetical protein